MRTLVLGDVHGRFQALQQVLSRSGFDPATDHLVVLGDIVDFGVETKECVEFLRSIPNKVVILGNHDFWFLQWATTGEIRPEWLFQGGYQTLQSYGFNQEAIPSSHLSLFNDAMFYYRDLNNRLYVHGGFDPNLPIDAQAPQDLFWDRSLVEYAIDYPISAFRHVFIGHTRTQQFRQDVPETFHNLTLCDTGAGRDGYLSIIDADTFAFWQSDRLRFSGIWG